MITKGLVKLVALLCSCAWRHMQEAYVENKCPSWNYTGQRNITWTPSTIELICTWSWHREEGL
jgi:hypothetical protein